MEEQKGTKKKRRRYRKLSQVDRWIKGMNHEQQRQNNFVGQRFANEKPVFDDKGILLYSTKKTRQGYYHVLFPKYKFRGIDDPDATKPTKYDEHEDWYDRRIPAPTVVNVVPRSSWGAKEVEDLEPLELPVSKVVLWYTNTESCFTRHECVNATKKLQDDFILEQKLPDIPYNFLVGADGDIYEGRGWFTKPNKVYKKKYRRYNDLDNTIDVAYIGPFRGYRERVDKIDYWPKLSFLVPMGRSLTTLLRYGVKYNYIRPDFVLHQDFI